MNPVKLNPGIGWVTFILIFLIGCGPQSKVAVQGELKKWHTVVLQIEGPPTSEMDEYNPFLNYRLDVRFRHDDQEFIVPGFYAADGRAAETSASEGNYWQVRFTPNRTGEWTYEIFFKTGENIAIAESINSGKGIAPDGVTGSLIIEDSDKMLPDNRAQGRLNYVGESFLKYEETGKYFIKVGVDAPENLLGFVDFDASTNIFDLRKDWYPHQKDFPGIGNSYLWKGDKGKNLMGAIAYLASEKLNVFSFLTFNVDGDDRNVFPFLLKVSEKEYKDYADIKENRGAWDSLFYQTRLDVSKLEQWERIFDFAETQGMFLHFKTHETETDHLMDKGVFGPETKLYYRELIARFGHHLALNWNLGEENNQPIEEVKKVADYVHSLDPYKHHLVIHTFPNQDDRYGELIGDQSPLTGASLQLSDSEFYDVHPRVLKWRNASNHTGKKWALAVDEPGKANIALLPDAEDPNHDLARSNALWGTLMAGGYGVEWYFGYQSPHSDLTCQDFRSRDLFWDQNRHARVFFEEHLPFWEMEPADHLTPDTLSFCLASRDEVYLVYLQQGQKTTSLDLGSSGKTYSIHWFNPRTGGDLTDGSITSIQANGTVSIGFPPEENSRDWVALIRAKPMEAE